MLLKLPSEQSSTMATLLTSIKSGQLSLSNRASEQVTSDRTIGQTHNQKLGVDLGEPIVNGRMVKMHLIERHRKEKRKARSPSPHVSLP